MQYVAELPAQDGAAGQREAQSVGPEGEGSLLPVSPQDDPSYMFLLHRRLSRCDGFADAVKLLLVKMLPLRSEVGLNPPAFHPCGNPFHAVHPVVDS